MACVTLKRPLEFDPLHPCHTSPASSCSPRPHKRRRFQGPLVTRQSPGHNANNLFKGEISDSVRDKIIELKCRQLLQSAPDTKLPMEVEDSTLCTTSPLPSPPGTNKDNPLFSFRQVNRLCEQMMRERENNVREQYDLVLSSELVEQYHKCVQFTSQQIHRQLAKQDSPSYMS